MVRVAAITVVFSLLCAHAARAEQVLRAGIVGCDTSHVIAFTKLINDSKASGLRQQVEIVAAFPGGSPDLPESSERVEGYTEQLRGQGITITATIAELRDQCDVFLLESVDGRVHLEQFRQIAVGKPVFIDKPAAASLADVIAIFQVAAETKTPCFTSSALRYSDQVTGLANDVNVGRLIGCSVASPLGMEPHHPDLFWYGVHGVESIYALMGLGCEKVSRVDTPTAAVVTGQWSDGRVASYLGLKSSSQYVFTAVGDKGSGFAKGFSGYGPLVDEICRFFVSQKPPVEAAETIEMFAFMEAADESLRRDGQAVAVQEIIARAETAVKSSSGGSASSSSR